MNSLENTIIKFKHDLNKIIWKINNSLNFRKNKKISFKDILYYCSYSIGNNLSFDVLNSHLKIKNILNVSKNSLIKQKNVLNNESLITLNNALLKTIYKNKKNKINIASDGTYIELFKIVSKDGIKISRNGNYCLALINTFLDIENEIPLNYHFSIKNNERDALMNQIKYLNKGDTLIMDRGYYSEKLVYELTHLKIKVIFRLKNNLKIIKKLNESNKKNIIVFIEYNNKKIKFRLIKYKIKKNFYYLGTTIYNKKISYFKDLYDKRWKIETHFKYSKYDLNLKNIKSKNIENIKKDILIHQFIFILCCYFKNLLQEHIKNTVKISTKNMLNVTINELLYLFLYKNSTKKTIKEIIRILNISKNIITVVKKNRKYKRIRKKPVSKWCSYGNKYGQKNKKN